MSMAVRSAQCLGGKKKPCANQADRRWEGLPVCHFHDPDGSAVDAVPQRRRSLVRRLRARAQGGALPAAQPRPTPQRVQAPRLKRPVPTASEGIGAAPHDPRRPIVAGDHRCRGGEDHLPCPTRADRLWAGDLPVCALHDPADPAAARFGERHQKTLTKRLQRRRIAIRKAARQTSRSQRTSDSAKKGAA